MSLDFTESENGFIKITCGEQTMFVLGLVLEPPSSDRPARAATLTQNIEPKPVVLTVPVGPPGRGKSILTFAIPSSHEEELKEIAILAEKGTDLITLFPQVVKLANVGSCLMMINNFDDYIKKALDNGQR